MTSSSASVSFVIPTIREHTFGESLDFLLAHLESRHSDRRIQILVVDDSSDEDRASLEAILDARRKKLSANTTLALLPGPRLGKGAAIRVGALAADGDVVVLIDADIPVAPDFIAVFLERVASGADVVIGVRPAERYAADPLRHVLARGLLALQTAVVFHRRLFSDTQCGFKAFDAHVLRALARLQFTEGGMYDLEHLYVATQRGLRIDQVPIELRGEVRPSRINLFRCIVIDPLEIFRFKLRGILGYYKARE